MLVGLTIREHPTFRKIVEQRPHRERYVRTLDCHDQSMIQGACTHSMARWKPVARIAFARQHAAGAVALSPGVAEAGAAA
jgi:hypothetical protein